MNYYKLIDNNNIIGAVSQTNMMKYQQKHNIMLTCPVENAEYVEYKGTYYHSDWMRPANDDVAYTPILVISIDEDEYNALVEALDTEDEIPIEEPEQEEEIAPEYPDYTLEYVKSMKLRQISNACENAIVSGVDVVMGDNNTYHYTMSVEDQLNILSLSSLIANGAESVPYHAEGEICRYYSAVEFMAIVNAATRSKTWHTTYHNALKAYVNSLTTIEDIGSVQYGMEVPLEFQSEILQAMIAENEENNE
mgnify:FL=1